MQSTMNVGIVVLVKLPNRVEHRTRLLRRRCAVEINKRMPMCLLAKNREILAKSSPINGLGGDSVHTTICYTYRCAPVYSDAIDVFLWHADITARRSATAWYCC